MSSLADQQEAALRFGGRVRPQRGAGRSGVLAARHHTTIEGACASSGDAHPAGAALLAAYHSERHAIEIGNLTPIGDPGIEVLLLHRPLASSDDAAGAAAERDCWIMTALHEAPGAEGAESHNTVLSACAAPAGTGALDGRVVIAVAPPRTAQAT